MGFICLCCLRDPFWRVLLLVRPALLMLDAWSATTAWREQDLTKSKGWTGERTDPATHRWETSFNLVRGWDGPIRRSKAEQLRGPLTNRCPPKKADWKSTSRFMTDESGGDKRDTSARPTLDNECHDGHNNYNVSTSDRWSFRFLVGCAWENYHMTAAALYLSA